ncbi:MAG: ketopantoate reductase family protein [Bullifex sp.]
MKIAVLGNGAMGSLFGSYLSPGNDVTLIGVISEQIKDIQENGTVIREKDGERHFYPRAVMSGEYEGFADLVICFVKGYITELSLTQNRNIIGPDTYLLTFQNGAGHDEVLRKFTDDKHIVIGTTQHNACVENGTVIHGGWGINTIGRPDGSTEGLEEIRAVFTSCGFETEISGSVMKSIWKKLLTNTSVSTATAVLGCSMHHLSECEYAWALTVSLFDESIRVAQAAGLTFDRDDELRTIRDVCENANPGYTSIYMDVRNGRKSEVDRISGYIVSQAGRYGIPVPCQTFAVNAIHALEKINMEE